MKLAIVEPSDIPLCHHIRVRLDGRDVTRLCRSVDEELGVVVLLAKGPGGTFLLARDGETPLTETFFGRVEITILPNVPEMIEEQYLTRRYEEAAR